jgi:hypothetical protein
MKEYQAYLFLIPNVQYKSEKSKINSVLSKMSKKVLSSPYNSLWRSRAGVEVQLYSFLTSALGGSEWSVPRPRRSTLRGRPSTHFIGGWVGPRAGLNRCGKVPPPPRDSLSGPSSLYQIAIPTTLSGPSLRNYRKMCLKSAELLLGWLVFGNPRTTLIMATLHDSECLDFEKLNSFPIPTFVDDEYVI